MLLGVIDNASVPPEYLRKDWGDVEGKPINPFYAYQKLSDPDKLVLSVWKPWLTGNKDYLDPDPNPTFTHASDTARQLHEEWKQKNIALRAGYASAKLKRKNRGKGI